MLILVDYDNIDKNVTRLGIQCVIDKIVAKIDPTDLGINGRHINIRLYGGWYGHTIATTRALSLSADIARNLPNVALLSDNQSSVIVNCHMAYSILADPTNPLFDTYRQRGYPIGLKARHPISCNCSDINCPVITTYNFLKGNICPSCNTIKPEDIFYKGEQKLVDTMLTSDLIFSSSQSINLGIVSSDDDFWPGIKTTLFYGKKIIHIHTKNRTTPSFYTQTTNNNYIQRIL